MVQNKILPRVTRHIPVKFNFNKPIITFLINSSIRDIFIGIYVSQNMIAYHYFKKIFKNLIV